MLARARSSATVLTVVVCLSGIVVALQHTLVIPLLHEFPSILGTDYATASWLVTATLLTAAVSTPIVSRLADMFGKRRMVLAALAAMVAGSLLAALGGTLATVLIGRGLQGLGSALIPVGIGILRDELPKAKVAGATAMMSATLGIGSALGLPLSGIMYQHLGWESIFWLSAAVGILLYAVVRIVVPESPVRTAGRFDFVGAVLLSVALSTLLLGISKGSAWGWTSVPTLTAFVVSAVAFALWFPYELRVGQPMVDLRTSGRRPVLVTNIATLFVGISMYVNMLSTTQQLEASTDTGYGHGMSVLDAGLWMMPAALMMVVFAPIAGHLVGRIGAKYTLLIGTSVITAAYVARVFLTGSVPMIVLGAMVVTAGTAIAYATMPMLIMGSVPITETASANGLNALLRSVGTSLSSAAISAVLTAYTVEIAGQDVPALGAFQLTFVMAAAASFIATVVAVFIPKTDDARGLIDTDGDAPNEVVVSGSVSAIGGQPIRQAVVTVLRITGEPVDWGRADNAGEFSVVLPAPGAYVVIASADGWEPGSCVMDFDGSAAHHGVTLTRRQRLHGCVTSGGRPCADAVVSLVKSTGEYVAATVTAADGTYELGQPPGGRYVITALGPNRRTATRALVVLAEPSEVDIELVDELQPMRVR